MSARVEILHRTGFRYDAPVVASYNEARITPMTTPTQQTLRSRVEVRPLSHEMTYIDYWGSQVTAFEVLQPHDQLEVSARSVVELGEIDSGLSTVGGASAAGPLDWSALDSAAVRDEHIEMLLETPLTAAPDVLTDQVARWRRTARPDQVAEHICALVHDHMAYMPGSSQVRSTATEAWDAGAGVCQDIAHITVGGLRAAGIPARYVSGYFDPRREPTPGEAASAQSHAWIEWWTGEWTAFDPTNAVRPDARHVVVARGRDYSDVPPLKGIYSGSSSSDLFVEVQIRRLT